MSSTDSPTAEQVRADDKRHVLHSWSAQGHVDPLPIAGAEGCWFWDHDGNRYLDLASQLVNANLGHQHPRIVQGIKEQADRLCTVAPSFANDKRGEAARLISERAPGELNQVFFTNGGAEANENAVRMARLHTGRDKILSAYRSYHGATHGAITLTGEPRRWGSEPGMHGVVRFFGPYAYQSPFHSRDEAEECQRALEHLESVLTMEGPDSVAAVIVETVVGTNGVLVPPDGYLAGVRELCTRYGIVMIADEVMVGFGRIGEWFAVDRWGVEPDLITFAKGVNSGYVPLGGVLVSDSIAATFHDRPYPGGLTYSGHPLACASAVASIRAFEDEGILDNVRTLGRDVVEPRLRELAERHPAVGEVRGAGLFWALELVRDRETHEPLVPFNAKGSDNEPMARVAAECKRSGVWPMTHFNRFQLAPPLVINEAELKEGISTIDAALAIADEYTR